MRWPSEAMPLRLGVNIHHLEEPRTLRLYAMLPIFLMHPSHSPNLKAQQLRGIQDRYILAPFVRSRDLLIF